MSTSNTSNTSIGRAKGLLIATAAAMSMLGSAAHAGDPLKDQATSAAALEEQAAEYRARAERHEQMAAMHRAGAGSPKMAHEDVARHCDALAKNLRAAADESEALADQYRKSDGK
jgi:hypothetical protein